MWSDIFMENKKHLINTLDNFIHDLQQFRELIKNNEKEKIFEILKRTKIIRKSIIKANDLKK
jgi:prephenate dehydrogenase